jgi:hypothetical protein
VKSKSSCIAESQEVQIRKPQTDSRQALRLL